MKKLLIISTLALSPLSFAQTESSFKYDFVGVGYSHAKYNDNDIGKFDGDSFGLLIVKEVAPKILLNFSASTLYSDYTYSSHDFEFSGVGIGLNIGTYIPLNSSVDIVGLIGFERDSFDTKISGSIINEKISDSSTAVSFDLGARIFLDQSQKVELYPSLEISRSEGETSKGFDIDLGFKLSPTAQVVVGYGTSLDSDNDVDVYSAKLYIYY